MFRQDRSVFAFTRRRTASGGTELAGESVRYGAITLLAARFLDTTTQRAIFGGQTAMDFCRASVAATRDSTNVGDLAVVAWAAAELGHEFRDEAIERLRRRFAAAPNLPTVEAAWALSAFVAAGARADAQRARALVLEAWSEGGGLFAHWVHPSAAPWWRAHVGCFADQVYPIQALARLHVAWPDEQALRAANRCAARICDLQGEGGQWWWHYDVRSGNVVEGYPVYSVHQDGMAPMALFDLAEAGGEDHLAEIRRGVAWMTNAPEIGRSLIDENETLIWRKVGRSDPSKLVRRLRAGARRLKKSSQLAWLDGLFPPATIDFESRPYHLAWVLYAWLGGR
jgi:hypothetical protein